MFSAACFRVVAAFELMECLGVFLALLVASQGKLGLVTLTS